MFSKCCDWLTIQQKTGAQAKIIFLTIFFSKANLKISACISAGQHM